MRINNVLNVLIPNDRNAVLLQYVLREYLDTSRHLVESVSAAGMSLVMMVVFKSNVLVTQVLVGTDMRSVEMA